MLTPCAIPIPSIHTPITGLVTRIIIASLFCLPLQQTVSFSGAGTTTFYLHTPIIPGMNAEHVNEWILTWTKATF